RGLVPAAPLADLAGVPRPAFEDLPLGRYLSPEPVLPYDASRGCFWGRCAFCHYGPVACGTAAYRERPMGSIGEDLAHFRTLGARVVYLSHDTLAPALGDRLAGLVEDRLPGLRWASDLRPDRVLDPGRCARWARGGALAFSLGLESGSQRVLDLMDKGLRVEEASAAVRSLAQAGLAVEAMLFLGFPTETAAEARKTLEFLDEHHPFLSLFMCGTFGLTEGSRVAREPGRFGVEEVYRVQGDELRTALFWTPGRPGPTPRERQVLEARLEALSARWRLRPYPWAGSLSTAHTLLWVDRHGPAVFREAGPARPGSVRPRLRTRHDLERLRAAAMELEAAAWNRMIFKDRRVGREEWRRAVRELGR
ncbi:MAG: radical SAM protein, partial [Deltaproteobacteria bacterium]|nr:radical SAM protein [Deltaproteobacteria bacterium]